MGGPTGINLPPGAGRASAIKWVVLTRPQELRELLKKLGRARAQLGWNAISLFGLGAIPVALVSYGPSTSAFELHRDWAVVDAAKIALPWTNRSSSDNRYRRIVVGVSRSFIPRCVAWAGARRVVAFPVDRDFPQPDGISFGLHWGQRFVETAGPISAASRDVFQPDIGKSWARMSPSFCRPTGTLVERDSISEFPFRCPDRHGRTRGFAGGRRRIGPQQIRDPFEGGEHVLVLVGRRRLRRGT